MYRLGLILIVACVVSCTSTVAEPPALTASRAVADLALLQATEVGQGDLFGAQATSVGPTRVLALSPGGRAEPILDGNGVGLELSASGEYWLRLQLVPGRGTYSERMKRLEVAATSGGRTAFDLEPTAVTFAADSRRDTVWLLRSGGGLELLEHRLVDGRQVGRGIRVESATNRPCGQAPTLAIARGFAYVVTTTCPPADWASVIWKIDLDHRLVLKEAVLPFASDDVPVAFDSAGREIALADSQREKLYFLDQDLGLLRTITYGPGSGAVGDELKRSGGAQILWDEGTLYVASTWAGPATSVRIIDRATGAVIVAQLPQVVAVLRWRDEVVAVSGSLGGSVWRVGSDGSVDRIFAGIADRLVGGVAQRPMRRDART